MGWGAVEKLAPNNAVTDPQNSNTPLLKLWDLLEEAGLKGEQVDVDAKIEEAGITDEKQRNLSWDVYKAAKQVHAIDNGASPTTYDSYGKELTKNAAAITDPNTRKYLDDLDKNFRSRVALNDQAGTYRTTSKKSEGATSAEYDAMLNRLAGGGELPKWEEVQKISQAQVDALEKRGVPKGNREAIRDILNNAYGMRANADKPEFKKHRDAYLAALNHRGEDNVGKDKNKGLSWTVSPTELRQFRSALQSIESKQKNDSRETKPNPVLEDQVKDQMQKTRTEIDQRRQRKTITKRPPTKRTTSRKTVPQRKTVQPQKPNGPVKPSIADLRRLDEQQLKAMEAEQEAKMLMSPTGILFEWNEDKRRQKIADAELRRREAQKQADEIKRQMGGN